MDFLALLLSLLLVIGIIVLIVLKLKQNNKVKVAFYAVLAIYAVLMLIFGFYPYEGFTSGFTMFLYYMALFVFCILVYKTWQQNDDFFKWFMVYNLLLAMHLVVDMIDATNNVFDDISISSFIYAVLNIILIIITLIKRDSTVIFIGKITGIVFLVLNTIAFIANSESIGESIFALILLYLFTAIIGGLIYWIIRKRIFEYSEDNILEDDINDSIITKLDDIT